MTCPTRDRVDWPGLFRYLVATQPAGWVGSAVKAALGPEGVREHDWFAQLIYGPAMVDPEALTAAVAECSDLDLAEADDVAVWLARAADFHRSLTTPSQGPVASREPGALVVDEDLVDLALVPLARDICRARPDLLAALSAGPLDDATLGLYERATGRVTLDVQQVEHRSPDAAAVAVNLCRVLGHELGHVVDPAVTRRSVAEREAFADAVADVLVDQVPVTLTEASPLIHGVARRFPIEPGPPTVIPSVLETILAFQALPLGLIHQTTQASP